MSLLRVLKSIINPFGLITSTQVVKLKYNNEIYYAVQYRFLWYKSYLDAAWHYWWYKDYQVARWCLFSTHTEAGIALAKIKPLKEIKTSKLEKAMYE